MCSLNSGGFCLDSGVHLTLGPRQPLGNLTIRFLCTGFRYVKTVADCFDYSDEAELLRRGTSPLRPAVFPVYASQLLFTTPPAPQVAQDSVRAVG